MSKTIVEHKFRGHRIDSRVETLILGTFNPHVRQIKADFFYGGPKNQLWTLLPEHFKNQV